VTLSTVSVINRGINVLLLLLLLEMDRSSSLFVRLQLCSDSFNCHKSSNYRITIIIIIIIILGCKSKYFEVWSEFFCLKRCRVACFRKHGYETSRFHERRGIILLATRLSGFQETLQLMTLLQQWTKRLKGTSTNKCLFNHLDYWNLSILSQTVFRCFLLFLL